MGMSVGSGGGSDEPEVMMDINTTPLIDVMLVLIIMLIITIPIQLHSVNMSMPIGTPPPNQVEPEKIRIDINGTGQIFWNGVSVPDKASLEANMRAAAAQAVQPVIVIRPDKAARYEIVAGVLASTQRLGLSKMTVAGAEQFVE
ncbi:MAG: biopolymer transporter ExbD [Burkholderiaceae bacterium]|nr:biopolymer transporter ExbD [Burkholderiaceae bacterium]